jgi:hypothetical protein
MTEVVIFCGSTLDRHTASAILDAAWRAPAARDDVAMAVLAMRPRAIGLIDGTFATGPAVSHKEILWAMSEGVHVFGSAGMGALRAAELEAVGMEGIGKVFVSLKNRDIEDDDEIAVDHEAQPASGLLRVETMVNIRATLSQARAEGVIGPSLHGELTGWAKEMFYKDRSYEALLDRAQACGAPLEALVRLRGWLQRGRVDQMRLDAIDMLKIIRHRIDKGLARKSTAFRMEPARIWVERLEVCSARSNADGRRTAEDRSAPSASD